MSRAARLGAFIVATLAILVAGVFIIGGKQYLFSSTYQLKAQFDNVVGLDAGGDVRVGKDGAQAWVLIAAAGSDIRVNGRTVNAGLWALANKDEIRAREKRLYFSNETVAEVVPIPGVGRPVFCGRCRLPIAAESPAVCCPGCGIWHHQGGHDNRLCWTYAPACSCCDSQTELGSGLTWV